MARPFRELAKLDKTAHEPARLATVTALAASGVADFLFLSA